MMKQTENALKKIFGLRLKLYTFNVSDDKKNETKKAKGISKSAEISVCMKRV